jgi:multidrug resistance efflux pump
MLELLLCSLLTILPDYLFRRYVQGKRIGHEINLFSVWFELRWGITLCLLLTVALITTVFFFHPSTKSAIAAFRTVPILAEGIGRVVEVNVKLGEKVAAGQQLFKLDSTEQQAAAETARRRVAEVEAEILVKQTELASADGRIQEARSALAQAEDELAVKSQLLKSGTVTQREVERLQVSVDGRAGSLAAALAGKESILVSLNSLLPAQKASAEAQLAQAEADLAKTTIYAGVDGTVEQFALRIGDIVNPMARAAGVLVPSEAGRTTVLAGFGQVEAGVLKRGMIAELACTSKPWQVIPAVVTDVQSTIAAGQVRPTDTLLDVSQLSGSGTVTAYIEPLFEGGLDGLPPGGSCIANAYTSFHEALQSPDLGTLQWIGMHIVDTVALVHAMILRIQAVLMPVQLLVFKGH